ncbi:hypothetical protein [Microbulbifer hainanensis]|nr:hypothetical protein [Microbulbifer hainanensis]
MKTVQRFNVKAMPNCPTTRTASIAQEGNGQHEKSDAIEKIFSKGIG